MHSPHCLHAHAAVVVSSTVFPRLLHSPTVTVRWCVYAVVKLLRICAHSFLPSGACNFRCQQSASFRPYEKLHCCQTKGCPFSAVNLTVPGHPRRRPILYRHRAMVIHSTVCGHFDHLCILPLPTSPLDRKECHTTPCCFRLCQSGHVSRIQHPRAQ